MTTETYVQNNDRYSEGVKFVYVVDHDLNIPGSLASAIEAEGYRLIVRGSTEAMLQAIENQPLSMPYHQSACAVIDIALAKVAGLKLKERFGGQFGLRVPVIIVTDYADVPLAVRAMRAGVIDIIPRPYAPGRLQTAIADAQATYRVRDALYRLAALNEEEQNLLRELIAGKSSKVIGRAIGLSNRTIDSRRALLMDRLNVRGRVELYQLAVWAGFF